jgi:putative transposase
MSSYTVRRVKIGKSPLLDELALECGRLYSLTLVWFWRIVRRQGIWLNPAAMMRWLNSDQLHAHTADACVQAFFASLKSWRARRKTDPQAQPPKRRRRHFRIEYKSSAIRLRDGVLLLSNGRNMPKLEIPWPWALPKTVVIRWQGEEYEAVATYLVAEAESIEAGEVAGVDLGEVHIAVAHDGQHCTIVNGRALRSKRRYQNRLKARLFRLIDTKGKGSRRRQRLIRSKRRQLVKVQHQAQDMLHKSTTKPVSTLHESGVQTVALGDVRDIRKGLDYGTKTNQKLHQWAHGEVRHLLTYKAERLGMRVVLIPERYTTQTCPACKRRHKPSGREYRCRCGFRYHRDGVGSWNIRQKYLDCGPVVGAMASPVGVRFSPHLPCSSGGGYVC